MALIKPTLQGVMMGLAATAGMAKAAPVPLDPAFVEYLEQFADQKGRVFDAADLEDAGGDTQPATQKTDSAKAVESDRNRRKEISK